MANEYCRHLSNGFRFLHKNLVYQPCCWVPESPPVQNIEQLNRYRNDITAKVLANKEKYCQDCIKRETSGSNKSLRQKSFWQIPESSNDGDVVDLSIQIDTTCNAACSICGPHFSSLWQKELNPIAKLENTINKYIELAKILDLSKLQTIRFYGGEPLVNNNHLILLKAIPNSENVSIMYSTNGSIVPDKETLEIWSKFKKVHISFSIDDIGERFHYIRWPLSWNKVKNNIEQFATFQEVTLINFNCTVNPMNILYFDQLESWNEKLQTRFAKVSTINISACYGIWGTDAIPEKLRSRVIEKYGNGHKIVKLLTSFEFNPKKWDLLVQEMKRADTRRNLSWTKTFPEVAAICQSVD